MASRGAALQVPESLKPIAPYIRIAAEHDSRNPVIAYWCRFYALATGLKMNKSLEARAYLADLMSFLEEMKAANRQNEAFTNDIIAQSHIEGHALKLFAWADQQDRNSNFDKSVVRAFHAAGYIFEVLNNFGELGEETLRMSKYAKWKAAYIHKCLKEGTQPIPGPLRGDDEGFEEDGTGLSNSLFQQPDSNAETLNAGVAPTPMPRGQAGNIGSSGAYNVDMGLSNTPQSPRPMTDESTGAFPKFPPAQQPPALAPPEATPTFSCPVVLPSGQLPTLDLSQRIKAQKYCKFATSALTYEDIPTAVLNLHKALALLTTGVDPE
ncbi:vacuolar protein sorting-associated protein VTA1 homolog isoform X1 [Varroa jacobsoni]|uniref:vacuolar protein sorting-associated protein VTA1 homolog isoform X1 n=1 Tax=Varroa jacobsoni TaxID=62625 RepID=UPI000BF947AA|nr:vacuolar protein sorting-associated protein VTA1 homolog isoform X1 [Varroa jacobsoni]XP_022711168.1 vacuolar protein sorting-associated protein VTA1 homolog isoform X1 [Varroa jacobsoni]XP_022711169.1 vacuolar protein sorting-associated protein VTA1 homolog isoform X1 [Varroa jacobsoni]XP_022711175.1 vacuolar protein sorting-associated protein VTA1 homolog isoform X1 [Varroa jacobsoni]